MLCEYNKVEKISKTFEDDVIEDVKQLLGHNVNLSKCVILIMFTPLYKRSDFP